MKVFNKSVQQQTPDQKLETELNKLVWDLSPARGGCEILKLRRILETDKPLFVNVITLRMFNLGDTKYFVLHRNLYRTNPDIRERAKKLEDPNESRPFWLRVLKRK